MAENGIVDVAKIARGPILLLAGPGTGKTHQLARRVKFLIEEKAVDPNCITIITFTGEAARNMRERLSTDKNPEVYVPPDRQPQHIRTMHSLANKIVTDSYRKVGLRKGFALLPDRLRKLLLADSARILGFQGDDGDITEKCRRYGDCVESDEKKCGICNQYQKLLRGLNAIDYDDQIFLACKLLENEPDILTKWQRRTIHLLIDEYQDINEAQFKFINLLSRNQEGGVFVVGDDDQSIYSWRGGSPKYIQNFYSNYGPRAKILTLDVCRRCPPHFLNAGLALVSKNNTKRLPKEGLHSLKDEDNAKVKIATVPSDKYEAGWICSSLIKAPITDDALVLVPGHRFAEPIKREMRKRRIPYDCKMRVTDSGLNAINDLLKWLKDDNDNFSLRLCLERIVINPSLRIPYEKGVDIKEKRERTFGKIAALWLKVIADKITLTNALHESLEGNKDLSFLNESLEAIRGTWQDEKSKETASFFEIVSRVIRPWASLKRMSGEISDWVEDALARNASSGESIVRILTMESAKGLGSDQVFIVGMNQGVFPPDDLAEEELQEKQRLLYVSMTRAKKKLRLFSARTREGKFSFKPSPDGAERGVLEPSPFLEWLPEEDVEHEEKWPRK